jgi:hypothetical protein
MTAHARQLLDASRPLGTAQDESDRLLFRPPRPVRVLGVAVLVLAVAVMPLGWLLSGGIHETWLPGEGSGLPHMPRMRAVLIDQTSLVRFITDAVVEARSAPTGMTSTLVVTWLGGCGDYQANLVFARDGDGFVLRQRTESHGCPFLIGYRRGVALHLWTPIDVSTVRVAEVPGPGGPHRGNSDIMSQD